jgi:uncharacterized membrane protein
MGTLLTHLRNKFVAGALAAIPIAIVVYVIVWAEQSTRVLAEPLGYHVPGLGLLIAVVGVYLLGLCVTSFVGTLILRLVNVLLQRVPGVNLLYRAWKDVLVVPPDQHGVFHQVVLVPVTPDCAQLGFTSGCPLPGDPDSICVLLPNLPSPLSGRLVIVQRAVCLPLKMSVEEALKYQLSTGNYLPPQLSRTAGSV